MSGFRVCVQGLIDQVNTRPAVLLLNVLSSSELNTFMIQNLTAADLRSGLLFPSLHMFQPILLLEAELFADKLDQPMNILKCKYTDIPV